MTVSAEDLERSLVRLSSRMGDRRAGIYGPGTVSWEVNREGVCMLGGGCAALMQLAHPWVAHAVDQHSKTKTDPAGRFQRTFVHVFAMIFGDLDDALNSARRVHALHRTIRGAITEDVGQFRRGDRYYANNEQALLWVHATLLDTAIRVYQLVVRDLSPLELEAYWAESKLFGYLFGLDDDAVPDTWVGFQRWYADMIDSDVIVVGKPAFTMRKFLLTAPAPAYRPAVAWVENFTAGLLPPKLREQFEFRWGSREQLLFRNSVRGLRVAHRLAPDHLRYFPAYIEARRRLAGRDPHDYVSRWLERMAMRTLERPA